MIVQHSNGSSYLFINNRVFVSRYSKIKNSVVSTELDLSLPLNNWEKEQIKKNIGDILPDGYIYKVVVHAYGSHNITDFNNLKNAIDYANEYMEDNGFANMYTNNINIDTTLRGGNVYYLEDFSKLVYPYKLSDWKVLCLSEQMLQYIEEDIKNKADSNTLE